MSGTDFVGVRRLGRAESNHQKRGVVRIQGGKGGVNRHAHVRHILRRREHARNPLQSCPVLVQSDERERCDGLSHGEVQGFFASGYVGGRYPSRVQQAADEADGLRVCFDTKLTEDGQVVHRLVPLVKKQLAGAEEAPIVGGARNPRRPIVRPPHVLAFALAWTTGSGSRLRLAQPPIRTAAPASVAVVGRLLVAALDPASGFVHVAPRGLPMTDAARACGSRTPRRRLGRPPIGSSRQVGCCRGIA